jgi:hypothetical protein
VKVRGQGREALAVSRNLGDFEYTVCPAWGAIVDRFGSMIKIGELRSLAVAMQEVFPTQLPKLSRTSSRRLSLIVKWFNDHWIFCSQVLPYFSFTDDHSRPMRFL